MFNKDKPNKKPNLPVPIPKKEILELLQKEAPDVFNALTPDNREKLGNTFQAALTKVEIEYCKHYQGPIPPPEDIAAYNQSIPNGADRIMKMAEDQSRHRIEIENRVITSQQKQSERGQIFGLIIGLAGILVGGMLAFLGHEKIGEVIAGGTVVSLVSVFVLGKLSQHFNIGSKRNPR
jgi:uncharacterized membrane protein